MQNSLTKLNDDLYSRKISNRQLSVMLGVSHTKTNEMLSNKREFDFVQYVKVLQILYPNDVNERRNHIEVFFSSMSPKNVKLGMEFLNLYGELDLQKQLVNKAKESKNRINRQLAEVYDLLHQRSGEIITKKDFHRKVEEKRKEKKITSDELKIVSDLSLIYSFLDYKNYQMVLEYTNELTPYIDSIKNNSLAHSFKIRVNEMKASSNHRMNNLDVSRKYCYNIINDKDNLYIGTIANSYCILAETFSLSDFEKAKSLLVQGLNILDNPTNKKLEIRKDVLNTTLDFLRIHWGRELELVKPKNEAELAFLYTKTNKNKEANEILNKLERDNGELTALQEYYKGLATGDRKYFEKSIVKFEKTGDFFYILLPKQSLK